MKGRKPARAAKPPRGPRKEPPADGTVLRLFVAGSSSRSRQAVLRVRQLCREEPAGGCTVEVIDIHQQPELARRNQIVATPTLIRVLPVPVRRFIGSLSDLAGLFAEPEPITKARMPA